MRKSPGDRYDYSYLSKETFVEYSKETCLNKRRARSGESLEAHQRTSVMYEVSNLNVHYHMYYSIEYRLNMLTDILDETARKLLDIATKLKVESLITMKKIDGHSETLSKILRDSYNKKLVCPEIINNLTYADYNFVNLLMEELNKKKEQYKIPEEAMLTAKKIVIEADRNNIDLNERAVAVYKVNRLLGKNIRPRIKQRQIEGLLEKLDTNTRSGAVPIPRGSIDTLLDNI